MKLNLDLKKGTEAVSNVLQKTSDASKKISVNVQEKAKTFSDKTKNDSYMRKLRKYNPLFPDKFHSEEFNFPNMIAIVDDAVRRGIDVCEGAVGWISNENGMEVMYLYDEFAPVSGIEFVPAVVCDALYYVDKFDRNRFVQTDCIFSKAHEERLAELKNIAYSLGAKRCSIEISESDSETEISKAKAEVKGKKPDIKVSAKAEQNSMNRGISQRTGIIEVEFDENNSLVIPELKWFKNDEIIKNLIQIRCNGASSLKSETLILEGAMSATMSKKTACAIDGAMCKIGVGCKSDIENQAIKENHSKLIFKIYF